MPGKKAPAKGSKTAPRAPRKAAASSRAAAKPKAQPKAAKGKAKAAAPKAVSPKSKAPAPKRKAGAPVRLAPVQVQAPRKAAAPVVAPTPIVTPPKPRAGTERTPRKAQSAGGPATWSKRVIKAKPEPKPQPKPQAKPTPLARRASDLPTVDGLTTLVLAKSTVEDGKLHLNLKAPKALTLPTLHVLRVEHLYELGRSRGDIECRFVLTAKLGGQTPAPDLVRTGDGWAATQDKTGYAQQVFRIPPGKSTLEFEVHAECYTLKKSGELVESQRRIAKGTIPLRGT